MYNVAILASEEYSLDGYIEAFTREKCKVVFFNIETVVEEEIKGMDAVIIEEVNSENIGRTCELIIQVRNNAKGLIWIVSKDSRKNNRIIYLQLGATGIFDAGIDLDEFSLVIRTTLDRSGAKNEAILMNKHAKHSVMKTESEKPSIVLQPNIMGVSIAGKTAVLLTRLEYKVLLVLSEQPNQVVPYDEILRRVWKSEINYSTFRLANLISHLRKKVEEYPDKPKYIKTIRSKGYMLTI
ncbi:winged helix-turn-helix domain-containing protein [Enterococcus ureasiticus]|uniref:OmpR/PhoB-type domain-containing protein n=1 Tax=Enterococcus ureasiticus TaxID=903984 RepID=A0A1E5G9Z4_9ENTE|nr:winged helix-turn-helix domain-containing protein [Enterococcus ureasiticus]OEG09528.1 hypothetical protein BCR21_14345 [Enterococcus ureasiticus]